jgi:hypothetical protein
LQRLPDAHVTLVAHVEIARPIAGKIRRPVLDQRFLRDQPLFDGKAVDERFQRRTRRTHDPRHVDPAGAAGVEEIRRADRAENFAGARVGHHHGDRQARSKFCRCVARYLFQAFLHTFLDCQSVAGSRWIAPQRGVGQMRGERRQGAAGFRHCFGAGAARFVFAEQARRHHAV